MTPLPDLLRSFLSFAPHWTDEERCLAQTLLDRLPLSAMDRIGVDPACILQMACMAPDPWQKRLLRSQCRRTLLLCSRQAGKTTTAAGLALRIALTEAPSLVLLLSPTLRQSGELFRDKVLRIFNAIGRPVRATQETALTMALANGSRIVSLPGEESTIRGFSGVGLLVVDEAARVPDELYFAIRPMLAVSKGRLVALSTPFGKRGWFHDAWTGSDEWERVRITAEQCPRIDPAFLAEEKRALGLRWYRQEYECSFEECQDAVFLVEDIRAALCRTIAPLTEERIFKD